MEPERPSAKQWWARRLGSYEHRYHLWCQANGLDPEDLASVLAYEELFDEDDTPTAYDYDP